MLETNEFGMPCEKCLEYVNPYKGFSIFGITFCLPCGVEAKYKLRDFFRRMLLNET